MKDRKVGALSFLPLPACTLEFFGCIRASKKTLCRTLRFIRVTGRSLPSFKVNSRQTTVMHKFSQEDKVCDETPTQGPIEPHIVDHS